LDVMTSKISQVPFPGPAEKARVFRIQNDQVLDLLGLAPRSGFRYGIDEFADKLPKLQEKANQAHETPAKQQDLFDTKSLELADHLRTYIQFSEWDKMEMVPPEAAGGDWLTLRDAIMQEQQIGKKNPVARSFAEILLAYGKGDVKAFNREVSDYAKYVEGLNLPETRTIPLILRGLTFGSENIFDFEAFFNHFAPFYQCTVLYVIVFVLACLGFLGWTETLGRSAFWLTVVTLVVHTWALLARMYLTDRWLVLVTNLYSSAVFIGWGSVILCLVLEVIYRNGIGTVLAAVLGSITLLIAHHLASTGDTLHQLQAVLDTNFWLATHVTCVTLGYTSTFVAGFLGTVYILLRVVMRALDSRTSRTLGQMIYGIVCFAMLFSFTGTVLGGIWADQSWGRFWGWDPKENGALLIVLMNALILHARWAGLVKLRGMAVLTICGNIVTGWSWFGTNQLGVGLHAYGFNNTLARGLVIFWLTQLLFIAVGLLPIRLWRGLLWRR